jgi:hypothetical protein
MPKQKELRRTIAMVVDQMMPRPRRPLCEKMCASCPFNVDRGRPKVNVPDDDFAAIQQQAEVGEFYCHETALEDPRTEIDDEGEPIGVQAHFKVCRGAWEFKRAKLEEKLRTRGYLTK